LHAKCFDGPGCDTAIGHRSNNFLSQLVQCAWARSRVMQALLYVHDRA
jgi:hypothetical protein